jgi:hypothetical protein
MEQTRSGVKIAAKRDPQPRDQPQSGFVHAVQFTYVLSSKEVKIPAHSKGRARKSFALGKSNALTVAASSCARGTVHRTIKHHVIYQHLPTCLFIVEENMHMLSIRTGLLPLLQTA